MTPTISVIIPTRNRRQWVAQSIASVLGQRDVTPDLLVVDDASTDGTGEWLDTLMAPNLRVIRQRTHQERSVARNVGLEASDAEFVLFLDDDDLLWPDALARLSAALQGEPRAVAVLGASQIWFMSERMKRREPHPWRRRLLDIRDELHLGWCPAAGQTMYRTQVLQAVGGFDPELPTSEDRDLWYRVSRVGPVLFWPGPVVTYRRHADQVWTEQRRERREFVARRAVRSLPREQRRHALKLQRSRLLLERAEQDLADGHMAAGLHASLGALATTPRAFLSPVIGKWTVRRLVGRAVRHYLPATDVLSQAKAAVDVPDHAGGLTSHPDAPVVHPGLRTHPIVVHRRGGVGNQLFQYAVGVQLAAEHGSGIVHTPSDSPLRIGDVELEDFLGPMALARWTELARFALPPARTHWRLTRAWRRVRWRLHLGRPVWRDTVFSDAVLSEEQIERAIVGSGILLNGYFQDLDWVRGGLNEVARQIVARRPESARLRDDVIALSFRVGPDFRKAGWTLPTAFYESALAELDPYRQMILWLISDEPAELSQLQPHFERLGWRVGRPRMAIEPKEIRDFWNLVRARALVLSCSTFAWWAAATGDYVWGDRHAVACPQPWKPAFVKNLHRRTWLAIDSK